MHQKVKNYPNNGEVYYKSEGAGEYDKKGVDLHYGLSGQDKRSTTKASSIGKGENEQGLISIKIANEGFGSDSKTFNLAGAIGHESFLHAEYFKDDLNMDYSNIPSMYRKYDNHAHHVYSSDLYKQTPGSHSFSNNMFGLLKSVNSQLGCTYSDSFINSYTWKFAGSTVKK